MINQLENGSVVEPWLRWIQPLNPQIGFNVNSILRRIQPLNSQIGFNVNCIQRQIQHL